MKKAAAAFTGRVRMFAKDNVPAFGRTGRITPWKMHGGIGPIDPKTGWKAGSVATGVPTFYQSRFVINSLPAGLHRVLRVATTGMGGGYVWINGHNLGRYPDHVMPLGLYIPSAWLHNGRNSIIIFDEQGHSPSQVRLTVYANACRQRLTVALPIRG
jgi:beta-galactosidase